MVTFDDFLKMDLRIGEIVSAENHPNADKLYLLKVKVGEDVRQAVAGIKSSYSLEELKGKKVAVLVNLEPKQIRGQASQCMVLATQSDSEIILIAPEKDAAVGSKIK